MMPISLGRLMARRSRGTARAAEFVEWAVSALVDGEDTPSLRILAGLVFPQCWYEPEISFEAYGVELARQFLTELQEEQPAPAAEPPAGRQ